MTTPTTTPHPAVATRPARAGDYVCTRCGTLTNAVPFGPVGEEWCFDCAYYAPVRLEQERVAALLEKHAPLPVWDETYDVRPGSLRQTLNDVICAVGLLEREKAEWSPCDCCECRHCQIDRGEVDRIKEHLSLVEDAEFDLRMALKRGLPSEPKPLGPLAALWDADANQPRAESLGRTTKIGPLGD